MAGDLAGPMDVDMVDADAGDASAIPSSPGLDSLLNWTAAVGRGFVN